MITDHQTGWLKEFLLDKCESAVDRGSVDEIVDTFSKLWRVALASRKNPYPRSPRLEEALAAIKEHTSGGRLGAGSI